MTVHYRCIGKGTTDSNGVAHITHDCEGNALTDDGYKGVGAGLMDFIASTDAPSDISESSFQSETYELMDCLKKYTATTDFYTSSSGTISVSDGVFSVTGSNMPLNPSTSTRFWTTTKTSEFDVNTVNTLTIQIGESSNTFNRSLSTLGATDGSHIKIIYDGTTITPFVDGEEKTSYKTSFTYTTQYYFNLYSSGSFSNFIVY